VKIQPQWVVALGKQRNKQQTKIHCSREVINFAACEFKAKSVPLHVKLYPYLAPDLKEMGG